MVPEVCWGQIWQKIGLFYHLFLMIIFMLIWLASASSQCSLVLKVCRNTTIGCTGIVRCCESEGKPPVTIGSGEQGVCVKNSLRSVRCAGRAAAAGAGAGSRRPPRGSPRRLRLRPARPVQRRGPGRRAGSFPLSPAPGAVQPGRAAGSAAGRAPWRAGPPCWRCWRCRCCPPGPAALPPAVPPAGCAARAATRRV